MVKLKFYKCTKCGGVIEIVNGNKTGVECCGVTMTELIPNTSDGAGEKHVPVIEKNGNKIKVTVGNVLHPMLDAHYITQITLVYGNRRETAYLKPADAPIAEFYAEGNEFTAYEYCNLHGLWKSDYRG